MNYKKLVPAKPPKKTDGELVPADLSKLKPTSVDDLVPVYPPDEDPSGLIPVDQEKERRAQDGTLVPSYPPGDIATPDVIRKLELEDDDDEVDKPIITANPIMAKNDPNLAKLYIQPPVMLPWDQAGVVPQVQLGTSWYNVSYSEALGIYVAPQRTVENQEYYEGKYQDTLLGVYIPETIEWAKAQFLFVIHGASRRCAQYLVPFLGIGREYSPFFNNNIEDEEHYHPLGDDSLIALADEHNLIVVCPLFEKHHYPVAVPDDGFNMPYDDEEPWNPRNLDANDYFYKYLLKIALYWNRKKISDGINPGGFGIYSEEYLENWDDWVESWYREPENYMEEARFLVKTEPRSDVYLNAIFQFVKNLLPSSSNPPDKFHLYGFSYGANFVTRYAYFNSHMLESLIVGSPGHSLFPDLDIGEFAEAFEFGSVNEHAYHIKFASSGLSVGDFSYPYTTNLNSNSLTLPPDMKLHEYYLYHTDVTIADYFSYCMGAKLKSVLLAHALDSSCAPSWQEKPTKFWQGPCPQQRIVKYVKAWRHYLKIKFSLNPNSSDLFYFISDRNDVGNGHRFDWQFEWLKDNWSAKIQNDEVRKRIVL